MLRLALLFSLVTIAFDALAASIARGFGFNYGQFQIIAVVLFAAYGVAAGQRLRWAGALVAVAIAVVVDATIGAYVATRVSAWVAANQTGRDGSALLLGLLYFVVAAAGVAVGSRVPRRA